MKNLMHLFSRFVPAAIALLTGISGSLHAGPVISEIMYHPPGIPEPVGQEFVEIANPNSTDLYLDDYRLDKGVQFTFPVDTIVPPHSSIVVVADVASFMAAHSSVPRESIFGPWIGGLANTGETVRLVNPAGATQSSVRYYSEGEWASRILSSPGNGVSGWLWDAPADGGGRSLELKNLSLPAGEGQSWGASLSTGGTPGTANSNALAAPAPVISKVKHFPLVPSSTDSVTVSATLTAPAAASLAATVYWRISDASPGPFSAAPMEKIGAGSDFQAVLPAHPHLSVVEFYVSATSGATARTWPAPNSTGQTTNCLYQVSNEILPAGTPVYRVVLSVPELGQFTTMTTHTDAAMNCTFIADDGSGPVVRYLCDLRYRGASSRDRTPTPMRLNVPADNPWNEASKFNLNTQYTWLQFTGMKLMYASGVRAPDTARFTFRRNGVNPMASPVEANYGFYVQLEPLGSEFLAHHFPGDPAGDLYKKVRPDSDWAYRAGSVPAYQSDGWVKESNTSAFDWTKLDNFLRVMNQAQGAADYAAQVESVADLDQWARWFAVETLLTNGETNASNGTDDDYSLYFRSTDGKAEFVPHDFDTVLGQGDSSRITDPQRTLFDMTENGDNLGPLAPLFGTTSGGGDADFRAKYFTALRDLCLTSFSQPRFDGLLDTLLTGWVPATKISEMKTFMSSRRNFVLAQCAAALGTPTPSAPVPTATGTFTVAAPALALNEILAKNSSAFSSGGAFPDYIELRNTTGGDLDLSGMQLSNDLAKPGLFAFPPTTILPAGGLILVETGAAVSAGLSAAFTLDQDGGAVYLRAAAASGGALLDQVVFGPQIPDFSISRTGDGTVWTLTSPTPSAANSAAIATAAPAGLRLNEWLALTRNRSADEFVELFNPAATPASLGGLRLTDDSINSPLSVTFPALSFIAPGGFFVLRPAPGGLPKNWNELPFSLSSHQDWLTLSGANGALIDQVNLLNAQPDRSQGRSPDGAAALDFFDLPTAGLANATAAKIAADASYALALSLMIQLRITELHYNPGSAANSQTFEYLEIRNTGTTPLDLTGVRFSSGVDFTLTATTLAPGAFGLLVSSAPAFDSKYGAGLPVLGTYTGSLSNSGELIWLQLPKPFDAGIQRFTYNDKWFPATDGGGSSLTVSRSTQPLAAWDTRDGWSGLPPTPGTSGKPAITSTLSAGGAVGTPFNYQIIATNEPAAFSALSLPLGLTLNTATGLITGIPLEADGNYIDITASNAAGTDKRVLRIFITAPPAPVITSPLTALAFTTAPFRYTISATNNPTSFSVTNRPAWLSFNPATGTLSGQPTALGNTTVLISASNQGGTSTAELRISVTSDPAAEALDGLGLAYTGGGTSQWFVQNTTTHDGLDALQAGDVNDSQESWIETTITGPDQLSFYWKCESESGFDYLNFNVDGTTEQRIAGNVDWAQVVYDLPAGTHTIRWIYRKDSSVSTGQDTAWLDEVHIASATPEPIIISARTAIAYEGEPFSFQVIATHEPTSYTATNLPAGLTLDSATGLITGTPTVGGTFLVAVSATGPTGTGTSGLSLAISSSPASFAAAVDAPTLEFTRGGNSQWNTTTTVTHDAVDAARSGALGSNEESWVQITLTGPDRVTWWWKQVSPNYNIYTYFLDNDGYTPLSLSGNQDWTQVTYDVPAGVHTLKWRAFSYSTAPPASDGVWLDQITAVSQFPTPGVLSPVFANGFQDTPFSYQISATKNPQSFATSALPPGLELDPVTGVISGTPTVLGRSTVTVSATGETGTGSAPILFSITASPAAFAAAADSPWLEWIRSGTLHWTAETSTTHDRVDAVQTPALANGQSSTISTTVTGPDRVAFWWKIDSENGYIYFEVDGFRYYTYISGTKDWQYFTYDLSPGPHAISWQYYQSGSPTAGANAAWVDQVRLASKEFVLMNPTSVSGVTGTDFSLQLLASQNPATFTTGALPAGLSLSPATGVISGTTTFQGKWETTITGTFNGESITGPLSLSFVPSAAGLALGGDAPGIEWAHSTEYTEYWFNQSTTTRDGVDALQSPPIEGTGYGEMTFTVTGPGTVSFWWRMASPSFNSQLYCYRNDSYEGSLSGDANWTNKTVTLIEGRNVIRIQYYKYSSSISGAEAGYVDQITFTPDDTDTDGLGDGWETAQFTDLAATAAGDPDGDGMTNADEQRAGTNPRDPSSCVRVVSSAMNPDKSFSLTWASVPGHTYTLEYSTNLASWTPLATRVWAGTGTTTMKVLPLGTSITSTSLVTGTSPARALVPGSSTNNLLWRGGDEAGFASAGGDASWVAGSQGVGYERDPNASSSNVPYTPYIGLDLQSRMYNTRTSAFIRIPFTVANPAAMQRLLFQMRYDDGFAAFINGQYIAGDNVSGTLAYNSSASTSRNDSSAVVYKTYDISGRIAALKPGTNILAVQGLNQTLTSSDFLIQAQLTATQAPTALSYQPKLHWRVRPQ